MTLPDFVPLLFAASGSGISGAADQIVAGVAKGATTLREQAVAIAGALLPFCLNLRITICGFKVMMYNQEIASELTTVTFRVLIIMGVVYSTMYSDIMDNVAKGIAGAGRQSAQTLGSAMGSNLSSAEPIDYWSDWVNGKDSDGSRFGYSYISKKIINAETLMEQANSSLSALKSKQTSETSAMDGVKDISPVAGVLLKGFGTFLGSMFVSIAIAFAFITAGLTGLVAAVACIALAAFSFLGGYVGVQSVYYVVWSLGVAVMPLCLFDRFRDLWWEWLSFLIGSLLAIYFFYVFNALGFGIVDLIVKHIFENGLLSKLLGDAAAKAFYGAYPTIADALAKLGISGGQEILASLFPVAVWLGGIAIVSVLIAGGLSMGAAGIACGFSFQRAFANDAMLDVVNRMFQNVQGGVSTFTGVLGNKAVQAGSQSIQGGVSLLRGVGNLFRKK